MSQYDSPDWQRIVTVQSGGSVSDAPDWQRVVTGPSASPIGGGATGWSPEFFQAGPWTFPPYVPVVASNFSPNGNIWITALPCSSTYVMNEVWMTITTADTHLKANENYVGIYNITAANSPNGPLTLMGASATGAADNLFNHTGLRSIGMSSSITLTAGNLYYVAILINSTTPAFRCYVSSLDTALFGQGGTMSSQLGVGSVAWYDSAAYTALPANFNLASSFAREALFAYVL